MDQSSSERLSSSDIDVLRLVLNETIDTSSIGSYYLLSKRFINAVIDFNSDRDPLSILCKEQYNYDLLESWYNGYPILKESLRQGRDYIVIPQRISLLIDRYFKGIKLKRARYLKMQRFLAYTKPIRYVVVTPEQLSEERELQVLEHYVAPDITCQALADELREKQYPKEAYPHFNHVLWLSTISTPSTYKQISSRHHLYDTRTYLDDPRLYKINRKFKTPLFILEIVDGIKSKIVPPKRFCYNHSEKQAAYLCLCLHERSFSCSKQCWLASKKHLNRCIYVPHDDINTYVAEKKIEKGHGNVGLYNEKNMCFFNTAVQCLARAKSLTDYFFQGLEYKDRNSWCKEGTFGSVALHYGQFIRQLWKKQQIQPINQDKRYIHMDLFRCASRWNPEYTRKTQQDAHEFIIKLLDWLKEDLNRNQDTPKYKLLDQNIPDSELFKQRKANLKKRNDSIIQDHFQWYLRSITTCLVCKNKSTSYDSMLTLQLPLVNCPTANQSRYKVQRQLVNIFFMKTPLEYIQKLTISVEPNDTSDFIKQLIMKQFMGASQAQYGIYKVSKHNGYKEVKHGHEMMKLENNVQVLYCIHKYAFSSSFNFTEIKFQIEEENSEKPGEYLKNNYFQRPIFMLKRITGHNLHGKVLQYFWKRLADNSLRDRQNPQNFFLRHYRDKDFPFRLFKRVEKQVTTETGEKNIQFEEEIIPLEKQNIQIVTFDEKSKLIMRVKLQNNIKIKNILIFKKNIRGDLRGLECKIPKVEDPAIEDCINAFCKSQIIDNEWNCPSCKRIQSVSKSISFIELPRILIVSLNRFKRDYQTGKYKKNDKLVLYSEYLDFSPYIKGQDKTKACRYRLFAVANHINLGESSTDVVNISGHYHAYIRDNESWKKYNDEEITNISLYKALNNQTAYILFYERVN